MLVNSDGSGVLPSYIDINGNQLQVHSDEYIDLGTTSFDLYVTLDNEELSSS